ncbi:hypothetical protein IU433_29820 [Nocardia puris]|uniref:Uncharacterized protein n=1 Tax=Nocardia puris TaxID=208602 RepID=A0A366D128_9NOCA|nr:hypothetical protein [Nocardia puris]MBF6215117.1 hypothetical protein [Nocardia puris]MBF6369628.1 hypothetical protein [Nocardia puris]MBF6463203.1 hypothetical protein [Nocardia puris]RBO83646.1 hypothetical protein DFR74_11871 [Nocardia puris]
MAAGDDGDEIETMDGTQPDPPDPVLPRGRLDPAVDSVWLGRRRTPAHLGRPRLSTVLLVTVFIALLSLYVALRPGG